jgi:hypothetical protein
MTHKPLTLQQLSQLQQRILFIVNQKQLLARQRGSSHGQSLKNRK